MKEKYFYVLKNTADCYWTGRNWSPTKCHAAMFPNPASAEVFRCSMMMPELATDFRDYTNTPELRNPFTLPGVPRIVKMRHK